MKLCATCSCDITGSHPNTRRCAPCAHAKIQGNLARYHSKVAAKKLSERRCRDCNTEPVSARCIYCSACATLRIKAQRRAKYERTADHVKAKSLSRSRANPEQNRLRAAAWAEANPGRRQVRTKAWRAANKERAREYHERWRLANPERVKEHARATRQRNPMLRVAIKYRRRAREVASGSSITGAEWRALCARYEHRCAYCLAAGKLTADHFIPVAAGGSNSADNIVPACSSCNASKGARPFLLWFAKKRGRLGATTVAVT